MGFLNINLKIKAFCYLTNLVYNNVHALITLNGNYSPYLNNVQTSTKLSKGIKLGSNFMSSAGKKLAPTGAFLARSNVPFLTVYSY